MMKIKIYPPQTSAGYGPRFEEVNFYKEEEVEIETGLHVIPGEYRFAYPDKRVMRETSHLGLGRYPERKIYVLAEEELPDIDRDGYYHMTILLVSPRPFSITITHALDEVVTHTSLEVGLAQETLEGFLARAPKGEYVLIQGIHGIVGE